MSFVVAIPSYNRVETLRAKTLFLLAKYSIPKELITIFVANTEEEALYKAGIPENLYGSIVVGVKGLMEQRNFIDEYYPLGTHIVYFDDDVTEIVILKNGSLEPITSLLNLIYKGFQECVSHGYNLWGVSAVPNGFFMKDVIHTNLKFIPGWFYGIINRRIRLVLSYKGTTLAYKEDYQRSLQNAVLDGGVIRFSFVAAKTTIGAKGGLNTKVMDRLEMNRLACRFLMETYPGLVRLNPKRDGEVLLARRVSK
jgi:hypothetical protein